MCSPDLLSLVTSSTALSKWESFSGDRGGWFSQIHPRASKWGSFTPERIGRPHRIRLVLVAQLLLREVPMDKDRVEGAGKQCRRG
jgi:hypothetical protein